MTEYAAGGGHRHPGIDLDTRPVATEAETILLPVSESTGERTGTLVRTAAEMAGSLQASVHVLHVFSETRYERLVERSERRNEGRPDPDELASEVDPVRTVAAELDGPLHDWGMTMSVGGRVGESVSEEIVTAASEVGAKQILISGRHRTPVGKVVFGSTAQEVLLDAPCPVTFVREDE